MLDNGCLVAIALFTVIVAVLVLLWIKSNRQIKELTQKLESLNEEMEAARSLDTVTGLFNYPFFVKAANLQIKMARRHKWPVSLMIVDIDQLEKINLRHSFKIGNAVLKHLSDSLRSVLRSSDVLGRFGGSGVFILLPECDIDDIPTIYKKIDEQIKKHPLTVSDNVVEYHITCGGVTMYGMQVYLNQLMGLAEDALNIAKSRKEPLVVVDKEGTVIKWK